MAPAVDQRDRSWLLAKHSPPTRRAGFSASRQCTRDGHSKSRNHSRGREDGDDSQSNDSGDDDYSDDGPESDDDMPTITEPMAAPTPAATFASGDMPVETPTPKASAQLASAQLSHLPLTRTLLAIVHASTDAASAAVPATPLVPALAGDAPRKGFGDADDGFHGGDDSSDEHNEDGNDDDDGLTLTTSTMELYTATAPPAKSLDSSETASAALDQTGDAQGRHRDEPAHRGLSHGGEQALIAVGSISTFVLCCMVGWFILRRLRRGNSRPMSGDMGAVRLRRFLSRIVVRIPWLGAWLERRRWVRMDDRGCNDDNDDDDNKATAAAHGYDYRAGFAEGTYSPAIQASRRALMVQTRFGPNMPMFVKNDVGVGVRSGQNGNVQDNDGVSPASPVSTLAPPPPILQQDSWRANRASEISSLSSGFGDGDIVVEPHGAVVRAGSGPSPVVLSASDMGLTTTDDDDDSDDDDDNDGDRGLPALQTPTWPPRASWASRRLGDRDTVYTTTSQDSPPRFRSVRSWVGQQTGRVLRLQRAQRRGGQERGGADAESGRSRGWDVGDVPPVPGPPAGFGVGGLPPEERAK